jgi:hypothetical protein
VSTFKKKYGDLGTFIFRVRRVQLGTTYPVGSYAGQDLGAVPEKALKVRPLDVATQFSVVPRMGSGLRHHCKPLDKQPLATFKFKYRTRRALQSLMILERSPSPVSLEDRDEDTLTREEALELLRRERLSAYSSALTGLSTDER